MPATLLIDVAAAAHRHISLVAMGRRTEGPKARASGETC
jgi:hypothetical protein